MITALRLATGFTVTEWIPALAGLMVLYVPTYVELARTLWATDDQRQGPIILAVVLWFFWRKRHEIGSLPAKTSGIGWPMFLVGLLLYLVGRSQSVLLFEVASQIPVLGGLLLLMRGRPALRSAWFPLLFLVFMLPLPGALVDALTLPMKMGVSWATEHLLYALGYPISRAGVILQIGQYKLLVADACAGLHTLFTLEALGLLYLHLIRRESVVRNAMLALLIVPISFSANTIRVMALTLITYYFGDAAGQGFVHNFAGMLLFISALILIIAVDSLVQFGVKLGASQGREHEERPA